MQHEEFLWEVEPATWDTIREYTMLMENADISQQDYLEKMRALGMPHGCRPGANLRIVLRSQRVISLPTTKTFAKYGVPLPGLPR